MLFISHRGNLNGKDESLENHPDQILKVLRQGYHCEIDVRFIDGKWFLGHDNPTHEIPSNFLAIKNLWIHAKNMEALVELFNLTNNEFFWHEEDQYTLTSGGFIWSYPNSPITPKSKSICVLPEINNQNVLNFEGVCSDYIERYRYDKVNLVRP